MLSPAEQVASSRIFKRKGSVEDTLKRSRILVVEDDRDNLELMELTFQMYGFTNVRCTTDSREVLEIFKDDPPDIVLLDLHMPHLDGLALIEEIAKVMPPGPFLPIVLISGEVSRDIKERALEAGASDFLQKPYGMTRLIEVVEESLAERFAGDGLRSKADC
jgi:CheY-like chemotaxis protein